MVPSLYKHTARSYYDVYNPLVAAYPKKPTWLFKEISGMFDFQSELMNIIATDILYPITRESAYSFANLCDYSPSEASAATDTLTITLNSAMTKSLASGYQIGGVSASTGDTVIYETTAAGTSGGTDTITVACQQKRSYTNKLLFTITSSDDFADYAVDGYTNILEDSISLTINGDSWTKVSNFDDSLSTDKHFVLIYQSSGKIRIGFGDGVTGAKPTVNSSVYGDFSITQGLTGRMDAGEITINIGGDSDISSITNAGSEGGADAESVASIIRNARGNVRLRNIVWSEEDLQLAATASSSSVVKALGLANTPDVGQATIHIIQAGGAPVTGTLLTEVDQYVTNLTQFSAMPVWVSGATYKEADITITYELRDDYDGDTLDDLMEFAMTLTSSAIDNEITEYYDDNGISDVREDLINTYWSWGFTSDEEDALTDIIEKWQELLDDRTQDYRDWGDSLLVSDCWLMSKVLEKYGADEISVVSPTSNITCSGTQIINTGSITVTRI